MIILKVISLVLLIWCVKYVIDIFNNKKENIGIDNAVILGIIGLFLIIIFG